MVVVWLHILGPYWCLYVCYTVRQYTVVLQSTVYLTLFGSKCITGSNAEQCNTHTDTNKDPIYAATPPPY